LVIFCVALVAAMRLRKSLRLGIASQSLPFIVTPGLGPGMTSPAMTALCERLGVGIDHALELGGRSVVEVA
jgi:hypothetical protein